MIVDLFNEILSGEFKTVGVYKPETDSTLIYVYWRDNNRKIWARTSTQARVEVAEGADIPIYTSIPGKLEMV